MNIRGGTTECGLCDGTGRCARLIRLLDAAERIMQASVRNGEPNVEAVRRWHLEKQRLCDRYPKSLKEMGHAP